MAPPPTQNRRRFLGVSGLTIASQLGLGSPTKGTSSVAAQTDLPQNSTGTHTSFKSLKQIEAGLLNVGFAEDGPADGPPVVLLHGWPYDIHSYVDVAPLLAARGTG